MAIGVLVEALLPSSGGVAAEGKGGIDGKPKNVKEWLGKKLKALSFSDVLWQGSHPFPT